MVRPGPCYAIGLIFLLLAACGESPPQQPVASAKKVVKSSVADVEKPAEVKEEASKFTYDVSRRDPFIPLLAIRKPVLVSEETLTPLQTFDLSQLRLMAVIVGRGVPTAMVTAPDGKGYILKKGVKVGKNNGIVIDVTKDGVQVLEEYIDFAGDVKKNINEIQLPKREGV